MCCCSQGGDGDRALAAHAQENNEAHTQTPARTHGQVDDDDDSRAANFNTPAPEVLYSIQIAWKRGYELPPFAAPAQPEVEALLRSIYIAKVGERTLKVGVTQATALQLYQLLCSRAAQPVAATTIPGFAGLYVVLGSMHFGLRVAEPDINIVKRFKQFFLRSTSGDARGLVLKFTDLIKRRDRDPGLTNLDYDAAVRALMLRWDRLELTFAFSVGGGGGGDPGGGGGPGSSMAVEGNPGAPVHGGTLARLDIRTRTLEVQLELLAIASRREKLRSGVGLTTLEERMGELPLDVWRLIDTHVCVLPLPRARRAETWELKCIRARETIDKQHQRIQQLQAEAHASEQTAVRSLRQAEVVRTKADEMCGAAEEASKQMRHELEKDMREVRAAAAARFNSLKRESLAERTLIEERVTELEGEVTRLEQALRRAQSAFTSNAKESAAALEQAEAARQAALEGRVWSRVREAEAKRERAERECDELRVECDTISNQLNTRSQGVTGDRQALAYYKKRTEELQEKVPSACVCVRACVG